MPGRNRRTEIQENVSNNNRFLKNKRPETLNPGLFAEIFLTSLFGQHVRVENPVREHRLCVNENSLHCRYFKRSFPIMLLYASLSYLNKPGIPITISTLNNLGDINYSDRPIAYIFGVNSFEPVAVFLPLSIRPPFGHFAPT
jgi:hypothetical protein